MANNTWCLQALRFNERIVGHEPKRELLVVLFSHRRESLLRGLIARVYVADEHYFIGGLEAFYALRV